MATRTFEDVEAKRTKVPLMVGLMGPSGGGKTFSALRLATGIQRVTGGDIYLVDTESRRGLHYADHFRYRHVPFVAPFGPLDYLGAIEHCVKRGAGVVIVDSMSHEHEGPGGVLEMHQAEVERMSRGDANKAERVKMLAWAKPKQERRRMINTLLQMPVSAIFCFRAKEKLKIKPGQDPKPMGFMPIAGEEFVYEMALNCLLLPNAGGVPTWQSDELGERAMIKRPEQFRAIFAESKPLCEEHGEGLARWAEGGGTASAPSATFGALSARIAAASTLAQLEALATELADVKEKRSIPAPEFRALRAAYVERQAALKTGPAPASEDDDGPPDLPEPGSDG